MRYQWEAKDIKAGTRYTRKGIEEVHMVGYLADRLDRQYVSISLQDGMVQPSRSVEEWAAVLTAEGYEPQ